MGTFTERDLTPEDTKDWPDALVGAPVAGPGAALKRPEKAPEKKPDAKPK